MVLEERRLKYEDRANGRAYEALSALAWQAHPYRHPVIGWRSDIAEVPLEACRDFFDTYYAPNNYHIVIVGDFETEPTLVATLESQLVEGVLGALTGEGLGGIDLPQLDLSGTLGLPPGTAAVQVVAEQTERAPGVTIVGGHL